MAAGELLTDKAIKAALKTAAETGKAVKVKDSGGLYLEAQPSGAGWWRLRYWLAGKENRLSLGTYPDTGLKDARLKRDEARRLVLAGTDPSAARKAGKEAQRQQAEVQRLAAAGEPLPGSFEEVARRWHALRSHEWAPSYADKIIARLQGKVFPYIGARPVVDIKPPELLALLRRCEAAGIVETAHRVRDTCSEVFRFAVAEGLAESDPARDLAGALRRHTTKHIASITDPARFGELLRAIAGYRGTPVVKAALNLAALVFLRPGEELRCARWEEFDLAAGTWLVPADRMKRRQAGKLYGPDHLVPLSRQAVDILRELQPLTIRSGLVFQGERDRGKPISNNTLNAALDSLGFTSAEHRAHGFRASARTMLHERLRVAPEVIEAQLAHAVPDALGRAYNRTTFEEQRRDLMQTWADYLDRLRAGAEVVPLRGAAA
ncbi:integrase arm-type DNA-binding domain-containing protein [uncultured Azohydromonas sp.]|jgi:Integrase|uniref:tyrosine-type recombinase/integrase n=1 Tax=uncultured Azohydromonas sp. TaxID=487342 RepID=UPI00261D47A7|nr:integrase arm-type DNA-binding domain-containing protein [uncultured Azohydromonas sp.]